MIAQGLALLAGLVDHAPRETDVPMEPERIVGGMRLHFGSKLTIDLTAEEVARIAEMSGYTRRV